MPPTASTSSSPQRAPAPAGPGRLRLAPPRQRRRPALVALALLLILVGGVAATALYLRATQRNPVLAVARPVTMGHTLTDADLAAVSLAVDPRLRPLPASARSQVVGQAAAVNLVPGTLLLRGMLTSRDRLLQPGQGLIGLAVNGVERLGAGRQRHDQGVADRAVGRRWRPVSGQRDRPARPDRAPGGMSVIALASAKGSPGVTTTALALAAVWPRRVLVADCDPSGGDLAGWLGQPSTPGLVTLGPLARRGLGPAEVWAQTQPAGGSLRVLTGFARLAVARAADVVAVLARPDAAGVAHLEPCLRLLSDQGAAPVVVLLGDRPYRPAAVAAALAERGVGAGVAGVVLPDPAAARRLAGGPGSDRALARSLLIRSARLLADTLTRGRIQPTPAHDNPTRVVVRDAED